MASLKEIIESTSGLKYPIGVNSAGSVVYSDFENSPHLLIAGATGTGKSVLAHSILLTLLAHNSPSSLRVILCDTKVVEFGAYNDIPNLLVPVCSDPRKIAGALCWAVGEIKNRMKIFAAANTRNLSAYNDYAWENFISDDGMPKILIVVDDLCTVISACPDAAMFAQQIIQDGRAVGVYLIGITQTPTWKEMKRISLSIPSKVIFSFTSKSEASLLIGTSRYMSGGTPGCCVFYNGGLTQQITTVIPDRQLQQEILSSRVEQEAPNEDVMDKAFTGTDDSTVCTETAEDEANLLDDAISVVVEAGLASTSLLQRRLNVGYARAARLIDELEGKGIVGPFEGSKPRKVLVQKEQSHELGPVPHRPEQNTEDNTKNQEEENLYGKAKGRKSKNGLRQILFGKKRLE